MIFRMPNIIVSTHSRPKAAAARAGGRQGVADVSTHSRPKAAANHHSKVFCLCEFQHTAARRRLPASGGDIGQQLRRFNTQPPEGGCFHPANPATFRIRFNTQPPEGGCPCFGVFQNFQKKFQHTAARRRLPSHLHMLKIIRMFQHTAARRRLLAEKRALHPAAGFNTQPPEGGCQPCSLICSSSDCFNTQPPEGGCTKTYAARAERRMFQHTAARRRLHGAGIVRREGALVSTHSRPKAAA